MDNKLHRNIRRFCSILIGATFLISGLLKIMDHVGTGLIVSEYLKFFHLGFLLPVSGFIGISLSCLELAIALLMLSGVFKNISAILSGATLAAFTIITAILLIFNPEMECGCFGEAIHLTHFQTFLKNIVLLLLWTAVFFPACSHGTPEKRKYIGFSIAAILVTGFVIYSIRNIPLIDFTDYAPGTELLAAKGEEYFPEEDNEFEKIAVLSFSDGFGVYQDELAAGPSVMISSVYKPDKLDERQWNRILESIQAAQANGIFAILLCQSLDDVPVQLQDVAFSADEKTLLTFNRSNGGFTYLADGRIIDKWSLNNAPDIEDFEQIANKNPLDIMISSNTGKRLTVQSFVLIVSLILLFV